MSLRNGSDSAPAIQAHSEDSQFSEERNNAEDDEIVTLEGVDFTKFVDVQALTPDQAKKLAAEVRAKERPLNYRYIERMKTEGVTEDLAIKAFIGMFRGNEAQTKFFLNADFYYGSDAPTPLDRLTKAVEEDKIHECIVMLEGTKDGLDHGDHF